MRNSTSHPQLFSLNHLDSKLRQVDEDRWLSSRYAPEAKRFELVALYLFYYELARVRLVVSDPALGAIRFQWWRDALEQAETGELRQHDVMSALDRGVQSGAYRMDTLHKLVDRHEVAFEEEDRSREPEAFLAAAAAKILTPAHGWGKELQTLAEHWAGLRRGEDIGFGPFVSKVPSSIRPAVAHFRLRRIYAGNSKETKLRRRLCVMSAVTTGVV